MYSFGGHTVEQRRDIVEQEIQDMKALLKKGPELWDVSDKNLYGDVPGLRAVFKSANDRLTALEQRLTDIQHSLSIYNNAKVEKPGSTTEISKLADLYALEGIGFKKTPGNERWAENTFDTTIDRDDVYRDILRFFVEREPLFRKEGPKREVRIIS